MTEEGKREIMGFYLGKDGTARFMRMRDELNAYYMLLGCDLIEMPCRTIGGLAYNIICDEGGKLKDDKIPTVFGVDGKPMIYGSVFLCLVDDEGECQSLTHAHCVNIMDHLYAGISPEGVRMVITGVDYR